MYNLNNFRLTSVFQSLCNKKKRTFKFPGTIQKRFLFYSSTNPSKNDARKMLKRHAHGHTHHLVSCAGHVQFQHARAFKASGVPYENPASRSTALVRYRARLRVASCVAAFFLCFWNASKRASTSRSRLRIYSHRVRRSFIRATS